MPLRGWALSGFRAMLINLLNNDPFNMPDVVIVCQRADGQTFSNFLREKRLGDR